MPTLPSSLIDHLILWFSTRPHYSYHLLTALVLEIAVCIFCANLKRCSSHSLPNDIFRGYVKQFGWFNFQFCSRQLNSCSISSSSPELPPFSLTIDIGKRDSPDLLLSAAWKKIKDKVLDNFQVICFSAARSENFSQLYPLNFCFHSLNVELRTTGY